MLKKKGNNDGDRINQHVSLPSASDKLRARSASHQQFVQACAKAVQRLKNIERVEVHLNKSKLPDKSGYAGYAFFWEDSEEDMVDLTRQHQEAMLKFDTVVQELKAVTLTGMYSLEGGGCHQSEVPEEVDRSPPKITHWPIIDAENLPETSQLDTCHTPPSPPGFWCE